MTRPQPVLLPALDLLALILGLCLLHYHPSRPLPADAPASVAIMLEIARMLASESSLPNDVVFLFTDAEEIGLWGARGFVQDHPWAGEVGAVINMEARGTSGPSLVSCSPCSPSSYRP